MSGHSQNSQDRKKVLWPQVAAFGLTVLLLSFVSVKVFPPMLLAERFFPGGGWIEIFFLGLWAGLVAGKMINPKKSARWRFRIWLLFSVVFFSQLLIGLLGVDSFLMSGRLHLPVPAVIIAGPLYRFQRFFMPILFGSTVLLVGPAWCSYLCYIGAWDAAAARKKKSPLSMPGWRHPVRVVLLFLVAAVSFSLHVLRAAPAVATGLGLAFGIFGLGIMLFWSQKKGVMVHCTTYCPVGILANWLGRLSPFRLRINEKCDGCLACSRICRYDALREQDILNHKPGMSCTLCGDCLKSCKGRLIEYRFLRLAPGQARVLFIVLVVSLHAVFLGVARI